MIWPYRPLFVIAVTLLWMAGVTASPGNGAPAYSVALTADPTSLETGEYTTLTATSSHDLTDTRWVTYVFNQTDPSWYRKCKVQSCSFQVMQSTPGTHTYIAYIARDRSDPRYPPMQIQATSDSVTVTWMTPTYTVTLDADRSWLPPGSTTTLAAHANKDMTGRSVAVQIFDLTTGERIATCSTGTTCSVAVSQVTPTTHAYQAFIAEQGTTPPPPNVQASSNIVSITWSVLPDPTRPPNVGGGPVTGTVAFAGMGVPPADEPCVATSFTFEGSSGSAWVNGSGNVYVGPLTLFGQGDSDCETASTGSGTVGVSASGENGLGHHLSCGPLEGTFTRVATDVSVVVSGDCVISGFSAFRINFIAKGHFVPTNEGGGLTAPVTEATFLGAFTVIPS